MLQQVSEEIQITNFSSFVNSGHRHSIDQEIKKYKHITECGSKNLLQGKAEITRDKGMLHASVTEANILTSDEFNMNSISRDNFNKDLPKGTPID